MASITVSDNTPLDQFTATGGQTIFPYTFFLETAAGLNVFVNDVLQTLTTDYTVGALLDDNGGDCTFVVGLTVGDKVSLSRSTILERQSDFTTAGDFKADVLDLELTRTIVMVQDVSHGLDRTMRVSESAENITDTLLIVPDAEADKLLGWNGAATGLENKDFLDVSTITIPSLTGNSLLPLRTNLAETALEFSALDATGIATDAITTDKILDGSVTTAKLASGATGLPKGYMNGAPVSFTSASTITIPIAFKARSSDDTLDMEAAGALVLDITASGANGLDTGSEASDTHYYVYLIGDSNGVNAVAGLLSTVDESTTGTITLPGTHDKKRQLPIAVTNDGSSDFLPFYVSEGWPYRPLIIYNVTLTRTTGAGVVTTSTDVNVLAAGTSATFAAVDCSAFQPTFSDVALLHGHGGGSGVSWFLIRETGTTVEQGFDFALATNSVLRQKTDSSQSIDYKETTGSSSLYIDVKGYVVTGVS